MPEILAFPLIARQLRENYHAKEFNPALVDVELGTKQGKPRKIAQNSVVNEIEPGVFVATYPRVPAGVGDTPLEAIVDLMDGFGGLPTAARAAIPIIPAAMPHQFKPARSSYNKRKGVIFYRSKFKSALLPGWGQPPSRPAVSSGESGPF